MISRLWHKAVCHGHSNLCLRRTIASMQFALLRVNAFMQSAVSPIREDRRYRNFCTGVRWWLLSIVEEKVSWNELYISNFPSNVRSCISGD